MSYNLFTHGAPRGSQELVQKMPVHSRIELEFGNVGFRGEGKIGVPRDKTSRSREFNQQQTQPTYDAGSGNRTRDSLVGGERSHHCTISAK